MVNGFLELAMHPAPWLCAILEDFVLVVVALIWSFCWSYVGLRKGAMTKVHDLVATDITSIWTVKYIFVLRLQMKVKSDHRSKFSNLSNWKEEAWKYQNFNRIRTSAIPVRCSTNWAVKPYIGSDVWLLPSNCLKSSLPNGFCLPIA